MLVVLHTDVWIECISSGHWRVHIGAKRLDVSTRETAIKHAEAIIRDQLEAYDLADIDREQSYFECVECQMPCEIEDYIKFSDTYHLWCDGCQQTSRERVRITAPAYESKGTKVDLVITGSSEGKPSPLMDEGPENDLIDAREWRDGSEGGE